MLERIRKECEAARSIVAYYVSSAFDGAPWSVVRVEWDWSQPKRRKP